MGTDALLIGACPRSSIDIVFLQLLVVSGPVRSIWSVRSVWSVWLLRPIHLQLDPVDGRPCDPSVGQLDDLRADQVADPHADLPFDPTAGLRDDSLDDPFDGLDAGLPADRRSHCEYRLGHRGRCYRHGQTHC